MADTRAIENAYTISEEQAQRHVYNYNESSNETPRTIDTPIFGSADDGVVYTDAPISVYMPFTSDALSPDDCTLTSLEVQTLTGGSSTVNVHNDDTDTYRLYRDGKQYSDIVSYGMEIHFQYRVSGVKRATAATGEVWVTTNSYGYCIYKDSQGQIQFTYLGSGLVADVILRNTQWTMPDVRFSISESVS